MKEYYLTNEAARRLNRQANTLRLYHQKNGHVYGILPVKVGSRLHWPKDQVHRVAEGLPALEGGA